ncbi:hypothetical protein CEXT_114331 [Caerostris extrusa]|uniref:Uncharacterized protein n=1 Tax=Caerostris extrusa TaxID=172846 RepID=A0AAV4Y9D9_CAEEX|nr:hypothetical protein CEXT_114331 [Caerostris extrusa]
MHFGTLHSDPSFLPCRKDEANTLETRPDCYSYLSGSPLHDITRTKDLQDYHLTLRAGKQQKLALFPKQIPLTTRSTIQGYIVICVPSHNVWLPNLLLGILLLPLSSNLSPLIAPEKEKQIGPKANFSPSNPIFQAKEDLRAGPFPVIYGRASVPGPQVVNVRPWARSLGEWPGVKIFS